MPTRSCLTCAVKGPQSFCQLSSAALRDLEAVGRSQRLDAGATLLHEGFQADRVFVLCSGRVKLSASSADGRLLLLRVAGPGDVLGLASVLGGSRSRISAQALETCVIKAIPRSRFMSFMEDYADVSRSATKAMTREYEAALLSARRLSLSGSAAGKLASALLDWARMDADALQLPEGAPLAFDMPLTHAELGSMAGLSRETVTRLLGTFRRDGLIAITGRRIVLQQPKRLESMFS